MGVLKDTGAIEYSKGLEGVIAALSSISAIDGNEGKLIYRGIPIEMLAKYSSYEETAYLLLYGDLPTREELDEFSSQMRELRILPKKVEDCVKELPPNPHPMDILKVAVAHAGLYDPDQYRCCREGVMRKVIRIIAQIPTIIAYYHRARTGQEIVPPDQNLGHAANFLYMLHGKKPDEEEARIFDIALILHAEHGLNASTFAAMVTASTLSDINSAIVSAIGALKGPLHGGANERVLKMLDEIGSPDKAEEYVLNALKEKRRIMGFGHRVYKTYDPRARILKEYAEYLSDKYNDRKYISIGEKIEEIMIRELGNKGIFPNVDFYSGIVYQFLGIPRDLFTPVFAMARSVGWAAHVCEYTQNNRIFRPRAYYTGPDYVEYVPIENRR
ncbi:2-methylcitrate synthase/citrate synthase II [Aciduliprofundum sp. MAR08-339]|uniref:citrate/2-methylcitrate synthase n=1 Tax=Aciduliprofundum sp. (strain MAR08-339) TaxID=673860 RepID=UPI0002A4C87B|nr:2-methylcitrate synthase/citrate synthase II [Aciduliprofundum sp. MAR08-339]